MPNEVDVSMYRNKFSKIDCGQKPHNKLAKNYNFMN